MFLYNSKAAVFRCLALSDHHMSFTADDDPNRGHHASGHPGHGANNRGCNTGDTDRAGSRTGHGIRIQALAAPPPPAEPERKPGAGPHRPAAVPHTPAPAE